LQAQTPTTSANAAASLVNAISTRVIRFAVARLKANVLLSAAGARIKISDAGL